MTRQPPESPEGRGSSGGDRQKRLSAAKRCLRKQKAKRVARVLTREVWTQSESSSESSIYDDPEDEAANWTRTAVRVGDQRLNARFRRHGAPRRPVRDAIVRAWWRRDEQRLQQLVTGAWKSSDLSGVVLDALGKVDLQDLVLGFGAMAIPWEIYEPQAEALGFDPDIDDCYVEVAAALETCPWPSAEAIQRAVSDLALDADEDGDDSLERLAAALHTAFFGVWTMK